MRSSLARRAVALGSLGLWIAACTEQVVVQPEGELSQEPPSRMAWPVQGAIVSAFGDAARPNHQGIDLAAHSGEPVAAAQFGRVDFAGEIPGYGKVIVVSHADHLATVYAHLGAEQVREGESVARGQTIGTISKEGYLHYEIRASKRAVDPALYYSIAPQPLVGESVEVRRRVAREPAGVGVLTGVDDEAAAPPPAVAAPPSRAPTRRETQAPVVAPTPVPYVPESSAPAPSGGSESPSFALGAAVVGANLFYLPAKLLYAGFGGVTGVFALLLAHDTTVANDIWRPALGGDYVVTADHVRGNAPLRFAGGD